MNAAATSTGSGWVAVIGAVCVAGGAVLGAVLNSVLNARAQQSARAEQRADERVGALLIATIEAAQHLRAALQQVRQDVDEAAPLAGQSTSLARSDRMMAQVRDDGVKIIAADSDGLRSRLYLAHDAAFLSLSDVTTFLTRSSELGLIDDDHFDEQAAMLLDDAENAVRHYLATTSSRPGPSAT